MRTLMAALALVVALGVAVPAGAQTRSDSKQTDRSPSVTIDLATIGGGLLGLVTASGLVNLYETGSLAFQGTAFSEAVELGTGLPLPAAVLVVILGGYYGQDIVKQTIAPLFSH